MDKRTGAWVPLSAALHTQNTIIYKIVIRSSFGSSSYFLKQYVCR
jgi:hypothetical protein